MSKSNMLATASLVLSLVGLIGYSRVIEQSSGIVFVIVTVFVLAIGAVSLAMAIRARREKPPPKPVLATVNIVVALGYLLAIGIVLCNIVINWVIR